MDHPAFYETRQDSLENVVRQISSIWHWTTPEEVYCGYLRGA
jgi:hypothetical protein